jgi:hypothetical protein
MKLYDKRRGSTRLQRSRTQFRPDRWRGHNGGKMAEAGLRVIDPTLRPGGCLAQRDHRPEPVV